MQKRTYASSAYVFRQCLSVRFFLTGLGRGVCVSNSASLSLLVTLLQETHPLSGTQLQRLVRLAASKRELKVFLKVTSRTSRNSMCPSEILQIISPGPYLARLVASKRASRASWSPLWLFGVTYLLGWCAFRDNCHLCSAQSRTQDRRAIMRGMAITPGRKKLHKFSAPGPWTLPHSGGLWTPRPPMLATSHAEALQCRGTASGSFGRESPG